MLLQKVYVAMGLFAFAFAGVVKLQGTTIATYPDACASECAIITPLNAANSTQDLAALCTPATGQSIITCYDCIQTDAPGSFTPQNITTLQSALDSFVSGCAGIGSPIPAITLPAATSHSGAMTMLPQTFGVAGLVVALTAMMVV